MKILSTLLLIISILFVPVCRAPQAHVHAAKIRQGYVRHGYARYWVTGYVWTGYPTASGIWPYWGEVAVDPGVVPMRSYVHIAGLGTFRALDTGGAVLGRHLDVFCLSVAQAYAITGWRIAYWTFH